MSRWDLFLDGAYEVACFLFYVFEFVFIAILMVIILRFIYRELRKFILENEKTTAEKLHYAENNIHLLARENTKLREENARLNDENSSLRCCKWDEIIERTNRRPSIFTQVSQNGKS